MKKPKRPKGSGSTAVLTRPVHIKFPPELYDAIKAAADADRRPLTHWIRLACEKVAKEQNAARRPRMPLESTDPPR
jgi:hypothetical protein